LRFLFSLSLSIDYVRRFGFGHLPISSPVTSSSFTAVSPLQ
jgi:hypothetical protein